MKKLIIANWKCHPTTQKQAKALAASIKKAASKGKAEVVVCPPFCYLSLIGSSSKVKLGAQNCFFQAKGAFTGEISPLMLKDFGCSYVLVGHSEREQTLCETYEMASKKIALSLACGLTPVLCVGETQAQKEKGEAFIEMEKEIRECLNLVKKADLEKIAFAYEPIYAIGTGKNCSADAALTAVLFIRRLVSEIAGKKAVADSIKVLYGGSVKASNAQEYLNNQWISGLLVGGASIDAKEFAGILKNIQ